MFVPPKVVRPIVMLKRQNIKRPSLMAKEKLELENGLRRIIKEYPKLKEVRIPNVMPEFSFALDNGAHYH